MGVLTGKDIFSSKWITAEITDSANRLFFVPIKKTIGDYFLAEIEGQVYCLRLDGSRIKVYQHTLVKSFRVLHYDLNHYLPVSPGDVRQLEETLRKNDLPKVNRMLFNVMKYLGKIEEGEFKPHNLKELADKVAEKEDVYSEQVKQIVQFLESLNVDKIVTPVKKLSEFLEGELITTDSKFMGHIVTQHARADEEHKKVTNTPDKGKTAWLKIALAIAVISVLGFAIYYLYDTGALDNIIPQLPFANAPPPVSVMDQYDTPEKLKAAIDRGEVNYKNLPPDIKRMVDQVETPKVEPKQ